MAMRYTNGEKLRSGPKGKTGLVSLLVYTAETFGRNVWVKGGKEMKWCLIMQKFLICRIDTTQE